MIREAARIHRGRAVTDAVRRALGTVQSFSVSVGVAAFEIGIEPNPGRADSGQIEIDFEELVADLAPALLGDARAFALFIDEMQDLDHELLEALLAAQHKAGQEGWPFYIFAAGLPDLPAVLSDARSYAERLFDYRRIGALEPEAAADALVRPAAQHGASFSEDALEELLDASGGYPYFLQTFGRSVWNVASNPAITADDAHTAVALGQSELDMGFFPARWDRATPSERKYLFAMAEIGTDWCRTSDVAERLGGRLSAQSTVRQNLIEKGIVYPPERGFLAFTVPGMPEFIKRQFGDQA